MAIYSRERKTYIHRIPVHTSVIHSSKKLEGTKIPSINAFIIEYCYSLDLKTSSKGQCIKGFFPNQATWGSGGNVTKESLMKGSKSQLCAFRVDCASSFLTSIPSLNRWGTFSVITPTTVPHQGLKTNNETIKPEARHEELATKIKYIWHKHEDLNLDIPCDIYSNKKEQIEKC